VQFSQALSQISRKLSKPDTLLGAVERITRHTDMPREPDLDPDSLDDGGEAPPPDWPSAGALAVQSLTVSHSPAAPPALRGVSFPSPAARASASSGAWARARAPLPPPSRASFPSPPTSAAGACSWTE
jgi:hypothetical protein